MADEVIHTSCYTYESDEEGIKDLLHFRKELNIYERKLLEVQSIMKILDEEKKSLKNEILNLAKVSEKNDAENAFLKAQISETEKSHKVALAELQKKYEDTLFENEELKKKEVSFQSYAKASDTLTKVHSYLRDPSEKRWNWFGHTER